MGLLSGLVGWLLEWGLDWLSRRRHLQDEVTRAIALAQMPATRAALDYKIKSLQSGSSDVGLRQSDRKLQLPRDDP